MQTYINISEHREGSTQSMANTPEPPISSDANVRSIADMPLAVETIFAFAKEVSLQVLGAAMLLRCWAWHQVPTGSLLDNDEALAAMVGLRRDVWQRLRALALDGFARCSDGRLYHHGIVERALAVLADVEKKEKRMAADRRRQKASYDRRKLARETGNGTPEPNAEIVAAPSDVIATLSTPPPLPSPPAPSPSSEPAPCSEPIRDTKPHGEPKAEPTSNGHMPQHEAAIIKVEAEPKLTVKEWDAIVQKYRVHGTWSWRSLGPSPRFPECRAPSFILDKHGYRQQAT
jgi:hypothetical protein